MSDLKFAFRQLAKNPGFAAVAVLSLSLGIAANTTIYSFVNALLIRPAPVQAPGQLWQVWRHNLKGRSALESYDGLSYPGYAYFREHNHSFASFAAFDPETPFVSWNRDGAGQSIQCQFVSGDFFDVCGVKMTLGRPFNSREDQQPGAAPVAVISHAFWKNNLASDPQIVGRILMVNGVSLTVVGVAPAGFTGLFAGLSPDLWVPFMMASSVLHDPAWHTRKSAYSLFAVGRLKSGITPAKAEAELTLLTRQFEDPPRQNDFAASVFPCTMVPTPLRGFVGGFSAIFMAAVFLVLLIACANAANLILSRGVGRRREMAVRASIGASRLRLIRQLLTESVLLAIIAGSLGVLITAWFLPTLMRLIPSTLPIRPMTNQIDVGVLTFTAILSVLTGITFGLAPALQSTRLDLASALKDELPIAGVKRSRLLSALVVGQVAVCMVLLIAGTLCLRSLFNARNIDIGFAVRNRVTAEVNLKDFGYSDEQIERFNESFVARVAEFPAAESVALADFLPLDARYLGITYNIEGHEPPSGQEGVNLQTFNVGPNFFATMGTTLLQGREFTGADRKDAPPVVIVNQAMAEQFWPGQNPIGRRLTTGSRDRLQAFEVIGVVSTGKYRSLGEDPHPVVFRCRLQERGARSTFVVHAKDVKGAMLTMRKVAQELDSRLALSRLNTLEQHLTLALFPARTTGLLFSIFGAVALMLAVSGLFGVIAYSVSQRTREIGIRMALGAKQKDVLGMVLRQGMTLVGLGIGIGLAAALALTRLIGAFLYGIAPTDLLTFAIVPLLLTAIALLACYWPARRAAHVDPMEALRHE